MTRPWPRHDKWTAPRRQGDDRWHPRAQKFPTPQPCAAALPRRIIRGIEHLVFLYDIVCYSLGGLGLLFAVLTAALHGNRVDGRYAAFMASFTLIIAMDTCRIYALNAGVQSGVFHLLLPYVEMAGTSAMIATLPRFIHSFSDAPPTRTLNAVFVVLALVTCLLTVLWINDVAVPIPVAAIPYVIFSLLVAVIIYSVVAGNLLGRAWPIRDIPEAEMDRWERIMRLVTVLTFAFMPLFVLIDFFPAPISFLSARLPDNFRTYPFFFLLWNLIYVVTTIPTYRRQAARPNGPDFSRFDLSPREREVVALLLEGLSYREISEKLFVSLATVKTHVNRVYDKTGAGNKMELSRMLRPAGADDGTNPAR